jgi:uncharacterized ion transporter superfamily protein YfcC
MFGACILTSSRAGEFISCDWGAVAVAALLFVVSYFLAKRHEWTRRILLVLAVVCGLRVVLWDGVKAFGPLSFSDISPEREHAIFLQWRMSHLSSFFFHLSVLIVCVLFLCQPDVVASFRRRANSAEG